MGRRTLATALACLLAGIPLPGQTTGLGVVTQSSGGHLGIATASAGATIYDGERLSTDAPGTLSLRAGTLQLALADNTVVVMNHDESGLTPTLENGSVVFRVEGGGVRLSAEDVSVRPQSTAATAGQMTLEKCAVVVTSRLQPLEVTAGTETKIVEEGKSYRVLLGGPCSAQSHRPPAPPGKSRFLPILLTGLIGAGVGTWYTVHKASVSPDRP
jgi:hypothetical protein